MSVIANKLDEELARVKQAWEAASEGSAERDRLHKQAQTLRSQGASEAVANYLVYGTTEGTGLSNVRSYMGAEYDPSADFATRLAQATSGQTIGQTTDTDTLREAARTGLTYTSDLPTYGMQQPTSTDLSKLYWTGPRTPIKAPDYQPVDTTQLRQAIQAQEQIKAPQAMESRFGTPEQFAQYTEQVHKTLQPYTEAQKQAALAAYNRAMQKAEGGWAARGLQASGAAMAQQRMGAQELGRQYALLEGETLERALNTALAQGQLSSAEAQAIWNQKMAGAQMGVQQAQFGVSALRDALGLEAQQGQFGAQLNLAVQQAEVQRQQALADNLARALGMDISQRQWGQAFNLEQMREVFNRALTSEQLTLQQRQAAQDALIRLEQLEQGEAGLTGVYRGQPTMQAKQLEAALQQQKWDQAMDQWRAEMDMDKEDFNRWLKKEALKLDQAKAQTDRDYKAYLKQKGITEQQGAMATQGYLTQIVGLGSPEEAFQYILQNADAMVNDGADVSSILADLKKIYPAFYQANDWQSIMLTMVKDAE